MRYIQVIQMAIKSDAEMLKKYIEFTEKTGKKPQAYSANSEEDMLGQWYLKVEAKYKAGVLYDDADFANAACNAGLFKHTRITWNASYEMLKQFIQHNHGMPSSKSTNALEARLGTWSAYQRSRHRKGQMDPLQEQKLKEIGFWDYTSLDKQWFDTYNRVKTYYNETGYLPSRCSIKLPIEGASHALLKAWCIRQEARFDTLSDEKKMLLEKINFTKLQKAERNKTIWFSTLSEVIAFRKSNGKLPSQYHSEGVEKKLGIWLQHQKAAYKNNQLSNSKRIALINSGVLDKYKPFKESNGSAEMERRAIIEKTRRAAEKAEKEAALEKAFLKKSNKLPPRKAQGRAKKSASC